MKKGINLNALTETTLLEFSKASTDAKSEMMEKLLKNVKFRFLLPLLFSINPEDEKIKIYSNRKNISYIFKQLKELISDVEVWTNCDETIEVEFYERKKEDLIRKRKDLLISFLEDMETRKRKEKEKEIVIEGDIEKSVEPSKKKRQKSLPKPEPESEEEDVSYDDGSEEATEKQEITTEKEEEEENEVEPSEEELRQIEEEEKRLEERKRLLKEKSEK